MSDGKGRNNKLQDNSRTIDAHQKPSDTVLPDVINKSTNILLRDNLIGGPSSEY